MHDSCRAVRHRKGRSPRRFAGFATRAEQIAMAEQVARALRIARPAHRRGGHGHRQDVRVSRARIAVGPARDRVHGHTHICRISCFIATCPTVDCARSGGRCASRCSRGAPTTSACIGSNSPNSRRTHAACAREVARGAARRCASGRASRDSGDIAELAQLQRVRSRVAVGHLDARQLPRRRTAPSFDRCHVVKARREAQAADVVVVNHHLLMADLVLKEEGFGDLLPGADAIIIDEAHQLPEVAANFLGFAVSSRQLQSLSRDLAAELLASGPRSEVSQAFAQTLERQLCRSAGRASRTSTRAHRVQGVARRRSSNPSSACRRRSMNCVDIARRGGEGSRRACGAASARRGVVRASGRADRRRRRRAASVRWAQATAQRRVVSLRAVDVAEQLGASHRGARERVDVHVGDARGRRQLRSLHRGALGMQDATTVRFGSPFDYERQTLLYLPRGLDAPSSPRHTAAGHRRRAAGAARQAAGARSCCSRVIARCARRGDPVAAARRRRRRFPCSCRATRRARRCLNRFREYGNAVLLGTSSFWEGVDVKGAALSVVVIDKLPFAAPDDPVLKARLDAIERRGGNPFFEEQMPQAVIALKQGVGRLMRDPDDFGVDRAVRSASAHAWLRPDLSRQPAADAAHRAARRRRASSCARSLRPSASPHRSRRRRARAMKLLAIDTATERCSVALLHRRAQSIERAQDTQRGHADLVLPMVEEVLAEGGRHAATARRHRLRPRSGCVHGRAHRGRRGAGTRVRRAAADRRHLGPRSGCAAVRAAGRADARLHGCAHGRGVLGPFRGDAGRARARRSAQSASIVRKRSIPAIATVFAGTGFGRIRSLRRPSGTTAVHDAALPRAREIALLGGSRVARWARAAGRSRPSPCTCAIRSPSSRRLVTYRQWPTDSRSRSTGSSSWTVIIRCCNDAATLSPLQLLSR